MKEALGILGAGFMVASAVPYIISLYRREVKPHAFSWILWGVINAVVFTAQLMRGAESGAWATGVSTVVTWGIALAALKIGEKNYTRSDWVFLFSALCAVPLWIATDDPLWSVVLVSVIDVIAFFPTIRKSWNKPHEESALSFAFGIAGFFFSLLAIENYIVTNFLYPAVVMAGNTTLVGILLWRRRVLKT